MRLAVPIASLLLFVVGCTSSAPPFPQPTPTPTKAAEPAEAVAPGSDDDAATSARTAPITGELRFVWTDFHFELGTAVIDIHGNAVKDLYVDSRREEDREGPVTVMFHRLAEYQLSEAEATELRAALTSPAFLSLDGRYIDPDISDGTTQTFTVLAGDHKQDVYCYHRWPAPVTRIREQLRAIQTAHAEERSAAPEVDWKLVERFEANAARAGEEAGRAAP